MIDYLCCAIPTSSHAMDVCNSCCFVCMLYLGSDFVTCENSTQRIRASWVCDGHVDCLNGADERRCGKLEEGERREGEGEEREEREGERTE